MTPHEKFHALKRDWFYILLMAAAALTATFLLNPKMREAWCDKVDDAWTAAVEEDGA